MVNVKNAALFLVAVALVTNAAAILSISAAKDVFAQSVNMTGNSTKSSGNGNTTASSDPRSGNVSGLLIGDGT